MKVNIKSLTGNIDVFHPEKSTTISELKQSITEKTGIPSVQIRLIYSGRQLNDSSTLDNTGISGGATVHMVLQLRGGSSP